MAPPGRAEPQLKRPGEGAKERKLHGVRRERMKGRSSREGGSSRQSILMRKLKRRSELRRQLLAKEVGAVKLCFVVWKLLICLKSSSTCEGCTYRCALFRIWTILGGHLSRSTLLKSTLTRSTLMRSIFPRSTQIFSRSTHAYHNS